MEPHLKQSCSLRQNGLDSISAQSCVCWEAHIFVSILIHCQMHRSEASSANLLLNDVLVDSVKSAPIVVATAVMGSRIEGFLDFF